MNLTQARLKEFLEYDPDTGGWIWLIPPTKSMEAGSAAGTISVHGYRIITIGGQKFRAARLAWLYMTGEWPANEVDHVNQITDDDRWCNIREASRSDNALNRGMQINNSSGVSGVQWDEARSKWIVWAKKANKSHFVGRFTNFVAAILARDVAVLRLQGPFARLNLHTEIRA